MMQAIEGLNKFFGISSFRAPQASVIETVLNGQDCLVVMPTGGGRAYASIARPTLTRGHLLFPRSSPDAGSSRRSTGSKFTQQQQQLLPG